MPSDCIHSVIYVQRTAKQILLATIIVIIITVIIIINIYQR